MPSRIALHVVLPEGEDVRLRGRRGVDSVVSIRRREEVGVALIELIELKKWGGHTTDYGTFVVCRSQQGNRFVQAYIS